MKFEETGLEGIIIEFQALEEIMEAAGFDNQFDYERITFDYKMIDQVYDHIYYLRVPAHVEDGELPSPYSTVKMMVPYVGKHYYPHGVEYDEEFPKHIVDKCTKRLENLFEKVKKEAL
ncbi:YugN family protein [Salipaludibacillus daqingensis]|uniref:YugN family protein n=1 Tax=Salipaludibacillus daqingensis TaxID=3041001 RepID=UPI00247501F1|nr:YugN family protein [Salipaludibacillus daqingensis]